LLKGVKELVGVKGVISFHTASQYITKIAVQTIIHSNKINLALWNK